jgi:hypothetical protein
MDSCAKAFDVVVPLVGVLLALSIYVQQRWNYKIVGPTAQLRSRLVKRPILAWSLSCPPVTAGRAGKLNK